VRIGTILAIVIALAAYIRAGVVECRGHPEETRKLCILYGPEISIKETSQ
jgi:hypothetical protein